MPAALMRMRVEAIKKCGFSEEQIAFAFRFGDSGTTVADVCRQIGVSETAYCAWMKNYADLGVAELRRLKMLEDENARLKRIVADLTLNRQILQKVYARKALKPVKRCELAGWIYERFNVSACSQSRRGTDSNHVHELTRTAVGLGPAEDRTSMHARPLRGRVRSGGDAA